MTDTVQTAIYRMGLDAGQYAQQANAVVSGNQKIITSATQLTAAEERVQQVTRATADEFGRMEAKYDPLIRAEQRRQAALAQTSRFLEEGTIDQQRYAAQVARVNTFYDTHVAKLQGVTANTNVAMGTFRRFGPVMQQAGYQVGDFAVQIAAGTNPVIAFTQQASQLLGIFGPWGAVLGAAAGILGVIAVKFFAAEDAAEKAKEAAENYKDAIATTNQVLLTSDQLHKVHNEQLLEEAKAKNALVLETQRATLAELELGKAQGLRIHAGRGGYVINPDLADLGIKNEQQLEAALSKARGDLIATVQRISDLYTPSKLFPQEKLDAANEAAKEHKRLLDEQAQAARDFESAWLSLHDRLDPVSGAFRSIEKDLITLDLALERDKIGIQEYTKLVDELYRQQQNKLDPIGASFDKLNKSHDEQLRKLEAERAAIGLTNEERTVMEARLEAENRLLRENIPLSDERAQAYIRDAEAMALIREENAKIDRELKENEKVREQAMDTLADGAERFAEELALGGANLKDLGDIGRTVLNDLIKLFIQLAYVNPLKNWGDDGNRPTLETALGNGGGIIGSLFNGGSRSGSGGGFSDAGYANAGSTGYTAPGSGGGGIGAYASVFTSILSSIFSNMSGFANGGEFDVAGAGGTDSQVVAFRATPGERVRIETPAQQISNDNRRNSTTINHFHFPPSPNGFGYSEHQMRRRSIERAFSGGRDA